MTTPDSAPSSSTQLASSPEAKPKRAKRSYNEEELERGLVELALAAGNSRLASRTTGIPPKTLENWARTIHPERYERIQADIVPRLHARIAANAERNALDAMEAQQLALEITRRQLANGDIKDASGATRNLATTAGIMTDKAALLRGRPTAIIEQRSPDEILNSMAAKLQRLTGQTFDADTTAVEDAQITEASVIKP